LLKSIYIIRVSVFQDLPARSNDSVKADILCVS